MERSFEPKILVPALIWGPVTGALTAVVALLVSSGFGAGATGTDTLVACAWAALFGGLVGVMCALPVGLVVAMAVGARTTPEAAARRGFVAAAVAAPVVAAVWLALAWLPLLLAWQYSLPLLLLVGALAGLFMSRAARRVAERRAAAAAAVGAAQGQPQPSLS